MEYAVVAPFKDFNADGKEKIGNELIDIKSPDLSKIKSEMAALRKKYVEDPVVLLPVIVGGLMFFIIVTKWGPEAKLPDFQ